MATAKTVTFKLPKNLAEAADLLYTTREKRLALNKEVEALQAHETALREHIINNLPKSNATGIAGKLVRVSVENKEVITVADWDKVRKYIYTNATKNPGVWGLMNKALNQATAKEMMDAAGKRGVPGLDKINVPVVSVNKLKS